LGFFLHSFSHIFFVLFLQLLVLVALDHAFEFFANKDIPVRCFFDLRNSFVFKLCDKELLDLVFHLAQIFPGL